MGISSDFTIDYVNSRIYHSSGTTVYSVNALYSYLQDTFDGLTQMNYTIPMSAQTPTAYTLINGWFMDEQSGSGTLGAGCFQYLNGGAITTSGYSSVIYELTFSSSGYTPAVSGDIGLQTVHNTGSTHTGTLLDYDNNKRIWWVRVGTSVFTAEAVTITGGTGAGTITTVATGEDIWPNIYTLGTIDQTYSSFAQQIYIIQNKVHITEWWPNPATPANRQIDVLIKTQDMGTGIDSGNLTILLRHYPTNGTTGGDEIDLYDNFILSGIFSGRNAVPLATANDLNNTISQSTAATYNDIKIVFVNGTLTHGSITGGPFTALEPISQATSGATGVFISNGTGTMVLGNVTGTFDNTHVITGGTSGAYCTATGSYTLNDTTRVWTESFSQGSPYNYSVIIDCATHPLSIVYQYLKYYTRYGASGLTYGVQKTGVSTWVVNSLTGEQYIEAFQDLYNTANTFAPVKQSPFGTFAGGKLFGATGVWLQNMASTDIQAFQLIDSNGNTRTPPNQITISVTNTLASDTVAVFATTGGLGSTTIWKSQYTSDSSANVTGNSTFVISGSIPSDTPLSGSIRVVKTSDLTATHEARYTYTSWTGSTFSGITPTLTRAYTSGDTAYVPYIDTVATGTSVSTTAIYSADRQVLVRVRRNASVAILPFETTATITSTGSSTGTIRTADTITSG